MFSFNTQASRARATYLNNKWSNGSKSVADIVANGNSGAINSIVRSGGFSDFADDAYASKHGYAIRENPRTGEKEMFVRGTATLGEWAQNALEVPLLGKFSLGAAVSGDVSRYIRRQYSNFLSKKARQNGVTVIYGHSRGAAVVEDMHVPGATKLGLDGATVLNNRSTIRNYRQRQFFDRAIGLNAKRSVYDTKRAPIKSRRFHKVYLD